MSSGLTETLTIQTNKAMASDWQAQLLKISMRLRLIQKYAADSIAKIHNKYKPQKEAIRNQIANLDSDHTASEYQELITELNELGNQEEREVEKAESEQNDQEAALQLEQDSIQTRLEAINKDTDSLVEMRDSNIKSSFSYFTGSTKK